MIRPYPYQIAGARAIARAGGRCLLGDEQGLGKSLQALLYLLRNPDAFPAVVVCPASLKLNWRAEARKHFGLDAAVLSGSTPPRASKKVTPPPLAVVNYDILPARKGSKGSGWLPWLQAAGFRTVILDECQYLINRGAARTKACRALAHACRHVLALSGTPLVNRPSELWPVLNMVRPDLFNSWTAYVQRYCAPTQNAWGGWDYSGACNLDELHERLKGVMIRRLKADVLKDLPAKRYATVPVPLSNEKEYRRAEKDYIDWVRRTCPERLEGALRAEAVTRMNALRGLAGRGKVKAVTEWLNTRLADEKAIIFANHTAVVDALETAFRSCCVRVDGSVGLAERQRAVDLFQSSDRHRLFVGQTQAAGVGLTLTAAQCVAFAELPWRPGDVAQAIDRAHRIGQTESIEAVFLVAAGTVEERIAEMLAAKQQTLSAVLDGAEPSEAAGGVFDAVLSIMRGGNV